MRGRVVREVTLEDRSGDVHVLLDQIGDDHIVTKLMTGKRGERFEITLGYGEFAWSRAVNRALRAVAFVS